MKTLLAALLSLALAALAFIAYLSFSTRAVDVEPARPADTAQEGSAPGDPPATDEEALTQPDARQDRAALSAEAGRPGDGILGVETWIEGHVILPVELPVDESLRVLAVRKELSPRRIHGVGGLLHELAKGNRDEDILIASASVDPTGDFRVPISAEAPEAWLLLDGRFLYLTSPVSIHPGGENRVVLEPAIGSAIRGTVHFPSQAEPALQADTQAALDLDSDDLSTSNLASDWVFGRAVPVEENGSFEIRAIIPGRTFKLTALNERFANASEGRLKVVAGRILTVDLTLHLGGTLRGTVVGPEGSPIGGADVTVANRFIFGIPAGEIAGSESEEDGRFEIRGVPTGAQKLFASADEYLWSEAVELDVLEGETIEGITLTLEDGASIEGDVRYLGGAPAPNAQVIVSFDPEAMMGAAAIQAARGGKGDALADETGHYGVRGLGKGPFEVRSFASPPEGAPEGPPWTARATGVSPGQTDLTLTLEPPSRVFGTVRDTEGQPVTTFSVGVRPRGVAGLFGERDTEFGQPVDSRTIPVEDPAGEFALTGLRRGSWQLDVQAKGFAASQAFEFELPDEVGVPIEITLEPAATVAGVVLSPTGEPVGGAKVTLRGSRGQALAQLTGQLDMPETISVGDGSFTLEGVASGSQFLIASKEEHASSGGTPIVIRPGERVTGVVLTLRTGGSLRGIVYDTEGELLAGAQIIMQNTETFASTLSKSQEGGKFFADHLDPGNWTVTAVRESGKSGGSPADEVGDISSLLDHIVFDAVEIVDGEEAYVVLGAPPEDPVLVFGKITEAGGAVGPGAITFTAAGVKGLSGMKIASFDKEGDYSAELNAPGRYHVQIQVLSASGIQQQTIEYNRVIPETREHTLDFKLPGGRIRGTVYGPGGDRIPGARVSLGTSGGIRTGTLLGGQFAEIATDQDGRYAFRFLRPDTYSVAAGGSVFGGAFGSTPAGGRIIHDGIRLGEDDDLPGIDFQLHRGGNISGMVRGPDGSPFQGASIFVRNETGGLLERFSLISTGADGSFEYSGLAPGEYTVSAQGRGHATPREARVLVQESQTADIVVVLEPGTELIVTILDVTGKEMEGHISVRDDDGREWSGMFGYSQLMDRLTQGFEIDEQRIGPLPAGHYTVRVEASDGRSAHKPVTLDGRPERRLKIRLR